MSILSRLRGLEEADQPSPNQHYYDQLNDHAERVGMGRPFNGKMKPLDYRFILALVTLKAIEDKGK